MFLLWNIQKLLHSIIPTHSSHKPQPTLYHSADSQEQTNMEDNITSSSISAIKDFIANQSFRNMNNEICGFVGFHEESGKYVATIEKNESDNPRAFFSINPVKYLKFKQHNFMVAVFHSHVIGDENPSEFDVKMSEACCLPFIIYSINSKKFHIYEPKQKDYDVNILAKVKAKLQ